jgi:urea transport system substrate-binding protein
MYTAACPNQQAIPAVEYLLEAYKGEDGVLKLYLAGSDYVYPRTTNTEIKAWAAAKGVEIVGEDYVVLGGADFQQVITKIRQSDADVIVNTINGDSNVAFFKQYKDAGLTPEQIQTVSFSACEEDIRGMGAEYAVGHLFAWNYFQTTDTPENKTFVEKYKALYGADRVTDDPIQDAYNGVYLWAQAVEKAGAFDTESVIAAVEAGGIEFRAPEGLVTIDPSNHHLYKIVRIGAANADGQIDEIWVTPDRVKPDPWMETYDWALGIMQQ